MNLRLRLHGLIGLLVFGLLSTACAVDNSTVVLAMVAPEAATGSEAAPGDDADDAMVAVDTAETVTNELGQELLPRFVSGSFAEADCDFIDTSVFPSEPECGWLTRPLHGSRGTDVELPVLVFRSTAAEPEPDPVIYLHGGPSGGILTDLEYFYGDVVGPYLDRRDVVIFDQRGTGLAEPDLRCDSPYQWFNAHDEDPVTYVGRTASTCAFDLFSDGIDLQQFSRQRSADDVMVLATELGYDEFNLHGSSWGGLLAYTVMQLHPSRVRASLLDSPLSISTDLAGSMPGSFQEAMNAVQANCDRDAVCTARHGDIVERYVGLFDSLDAKPVEILLGGIWPVLLTGDELSYLLFSLLYIPDAIAMIPDMLLDIENGNTELVEELASAVGWGWGIDFEFLTYMCTDIVPASSPDQVDEQQIGIPAFDRVDDAPDGRGHTAQDVCARMRVETPLAPAPHEVYPTTPTVVFSGSMDPITSRSSGQELADSMPNGDFVFFDDLTHGITHTPCGLEIALSFLDAPDSPLDRACADDPDRPPFEFAWVAVSVPPPA